MNPSSDVRFPPIADIQANVRFRPKAVIQPLSHKRAMDELGEVFLVYFEVGGGSAPWSEEGFAGGFVTCFVPSNDLRRAIDAGEAALVEDGYEVVNIDKVLRYEPEEWEHDEAVKSAVAECRRTKEISYSPFTVFLVNPVSSFD